MIFMDAILAELECLDVQLAHVALGDFAALEAVLPRRAQLLDEVAARIKSGSVLNEGQARVLRRSQHAGDAATRLVALARNRVTQELADATQEQRLWAAMSGQLPEVVSSWSLQG